MRVTVPLSSEKKHFVVEVDRETGVNYGDLKWPGRHRCSLDALEISDREDIETSVMAVKLSSLENAQAYSVQKSWLLKVDSC